MQQHQHERDCEQRREGEDGHRNSSALVPKHLTPSSRRAQRHAHENGCRDDARQRLSQPRVVAEVGRNRQDHDQGGERVAREDRFPPSPTPRRPRARRPLRCRCPAPGRAGRTRCRPTQPASRSESTVPGLRAGGSRAGRPRSVPRHCGHQSAIQIVHGVDERRHAGCFRHQLLGHPVQNVTREHGLTPLPR